jgi:selenocysteine lyase/cysteine desulfurase
MTKDEALELALEALEEAWYHVGTFQPTEKAIDLYDEARAAIKEALAQPEQEPISFGIRGGMAHDIGIKND